MEHVANVRRPRRVVTRTLALGVSAMVAAGLLTWSPEVTGGWNQGSAEATLWQLLNGARTNNGMAPLQQHGTLLGIARWRSSDMLARDYFSHTIPGCNCLVYASYDSNGLVYDWAGENIGWNSGRGDAESPVHVHEQFMASAGHRANVLTPAFTHGAVGAAAADGQMYQGYVQDTRMYTELFMQAPGAAAPAPAPAAPPPASGGNAAAPAPAVPAAPAAPLSTPKPHAKEFTVAAPVRPSSAAGVDGVAARIVGSSDPRASAWVPRAGMPAVAGDGDLEVQAAPQAEAGLFEGLVGALVGFLLG